MTFSEALIRRNIRFRTGTNNKIHLNCCFCVLSGHSPDTQMRLCVDVKIGWSKCVRCEWKRRFGMKAILKQLNISEEVDLIESPKEEKREPVYLPEDFQCLSKIKDEEDTRARQYVLGRGITKEQIRHHNIGVSYIGRFAYRIVFPVLKDGKLYAINGRDFTDTQKRKYLLSKGDKPLYNFNPKSETVILSEGVIKALRIEQVSDFNSSALLGHDLNELQSKQIQVKSIKHVILYPDLDKVGIRGFIKIGEKLRDEFQKRVSFIWPVPGPADDIPLEDLRRVVSQNQRAFTALFANNIRLL